MRASWLLLALAWPLVGAAAGSDWPPANHSPGVAAVSWEPREPDRGQDVAVTLTLQSAENVTTVLLRACRVQDYACLAPAQMTTAGDPFVYRGTVAWQPDFFRGVTQVGVAFTLRFDNGTEEKSPTRNWPATPIELPADADVYYFYPLPAESAGSPGPAAGLVVLAAAAAVLLRRRAA